MALDPAISLQAGQGVTPLQQPMDVMGKGLALQSGMLQMQAQKMQNQQLQQQIQDAQDFRSTFKAAVDSGQDPVQALSKSPSPIAQKYLSTILDMRQKGVTLQGSQYDLGIKKTQGMGNDILASTSAPGATPQSVAAVIQRHAASGDLPPDQAQEMMQELQSLQGPDALKNWGILQGVKTHVAKDVLGMFTPKTTIQGQNLIKQDPLTGDVTGAAPINGLRPEIVGVHADPSNNAFGVDKYGHSVPILDAQGNPQKMRQPASMLLPPGSGLPGAIKSGATGQDAIDALSPQMRPLVQGIVEGRQKLPSGMALKTPYWQNVLQSVYAVDPQWSEQRAQIRSSFTTGKDGTNIGSLNTATVHLADYLEAAQAMKNGTFTPGNEIYNKISAIMGRPAPTDLATFSNIVSGEMANALKGSATDIEIHNIKQTMQNSSSPDQFLANGTASLKAMYQKLNTYQERYKQQIPNDSWSPILPSANTIFQKYGIGGSTPTAQPVTPQTQASQPSAYKLGQVVKGYVFLGGDPTNQNSWKKQK